MSNPYDVAYSWLGKTETDDTEELNNFVNKYLSSHIDVSQTPWCAAFVNACLRECGIQGTGQLNAQSYAHWGQHTDSPQTGDIVVLWRGSVNSGLGHVGFVDRIEGNLVYILGGNESDAVMIKGFPVSHVTSYRSVGE